MIPVFRPKLFGDAETLRNTLHSSWWGTGPMVAEFEELFAEYIGVDSEQCIMINSCTAALHLAVMLYPDAKRFLLPGFTFVSTGLAPLWESKELVFVEVGEDLCIDQEDALSKIESDKDVIIVVHMGGHPANIEKLKGYRLIEDCAHSLGSWDNDRHTGTLGVGCFSFQSTKILPIGDGGMLVLPEDKVEERYKTLAQSWCGILGTTWERSEDGQYKWRYDIQKPGYKYRANDVMAAIAIDQWHHLFDIFLSKEIIAKNYQQELKDLDWLQLPQVRQNTTPNWQEYIIKTEHRDRLSKHLEERGISTTVHYYPIYRYRPFWVAEEEGFYATRKLPKTDELFSKVLTIPAYTGMTEIEQEKVIDGIKSFKP